MPEVAVVSASSPMADAKMKRLVEEVSERDALISEAAPSSESRYRSC